MSVRTQRHLPSCTMSSESLLSHLCLLYCTLTAGAAVKVVVNTPSVQVTRGGNVLLPCSFRNTAALNRLNIIWTVFPLLQPKQPLQVISYEQGQIVESLSEYLGRVTFVSQPTQDASIVLNNSRVSDTGTYQCTVINPPDGATPNIGLVRLTVLVPPSIPDCSSDSYGQEGGSIQLRCAVKEGIPTPTIRWEKTAPGAQQLISTREDYHAFTTLRNISSETSGLYRCTISNQLGSKTCSVELHISVGGLGSMGNFAAITITLIMGLVLLVLFILVLCLHQHSREKWHEELYSVDNMFSGQHPVNRSHCIDYTMSSKEPPHTLYSVRQSQPQQPTVNVSTISRQQGQSILQVPISRQESHATMEVSTVSRPWTWATLAPTLEVSSDLSTIGSEEEYEKRNVSHSPIYSVHSGYLV
ncbi:immunoglobulin superfamily member 11-like [Dendrobates tinctorius]|uniref:immunoglobulin superfamily member 11-like n=1 Tax=Dendrobates tinctorius TaxID=92724 RepID=UPI003CC9540E